jgi:3'-phosphoadenosine 5'-phosphosulfate sulfotransferase (PAPS reductase)/FAD synthetase
MTRWESRLHIAERLAEWLDDPRIVFVVNLSGGKDSTAVDLLLTEAGIPHRRVFADTGWEADETYAHLALLRAKLGQIDIVGRPGGMLQLARERAGFPQRRGRWCTQELKLEPLRAYFDKIAAQGLEPVSVVGVRAEESEARAAMPIVEDAEWWGGWLWRPIREWSVQQVIAIHRRHGVPLNPLYHRGHDRVGCFPCILSTKNDIRLVAEHAPERIALIREEEAWQSAERERRNATGEGNFAHPRSTFFLPKLPGVNTIDEVVAWSRTERGGRYLPLFPPPPEGGCFRWGLCEAPGAEPAPARDAARAA